MFCSLLCKARRGSSLSALSRFSLRSCLTCKKENRRLPAKQYTAASDIENMYKLRIGYGYHHQSFRVRRSAGCFWSFHQARGGINMTLAPMCNGLSCVCRRRRGGKWCSHECDCPQHFGQPEFNQSVRETHDQRPNGECQWKRSVNIARRYLSRQQKEHSVRQHGWTARHAESSSMQPRALPQD